MYYKLGAQPKVSKNIVEVRKAIGEVGVGVDLFSNGYSLVCKGLSI